MSDTCYLSGFNDYANFIRTFKNITGIPPGKYGKIKTAPPIRSAAVYA
ncbi:hypothetical protein ACFTAO_32220 [Paenibacillus rhizoplanae]